MTTRRTALSSFLAFLAAPFAARAATGPAPAVLCTGELLTARTAKLRVWKLGSLEHNRLPTKKAIDTLKGMLASWDGVSDLDLIWGPDLEVTQFDLGPDDVDRIEGGPRVRVVHVPESFPAGE